MKELNALQMEDIEGGSVASCGAAFFIGVPLVYSLVGGLGGFLLGLIGAGVVCATT